MPASVSPEIADSIPEAKSSNPRSAGNRPGGAIDRASSLHIRASCQCASRSSAYATLACVPTWLTDFRQDLPKNDVPTLVVHGTEDRILPIDATARRLKGMINNVQYHEIEHGPHAINWTHFQELNPILLDFLR